MLNALQDEPERKGRWLNLLYGVLIATFLQGGGLWGANSFEPPKRERRKAITMRVIKPKPKPKPKPKVEPPKPEPPKVEPPKPKPKPKPKRKPKRKPKPKSKPPEQVPTPKPPPPEPAKPPVITTGLTLSSTSAKGKGGFKVQVGNTMYGRPSKKLEKPNTEPPPSGPVARTGSRDPVVVAAKPTYRVKPKYTLEAQAEGVEGQVILRVTINTKGEVTKVTLVKGLGFGLDDVAIKAVRQWRFSPETIDSVAVVTTKRIPLRFTLED